MSRSLLARIEALEKARGGREPLFIVYQMIADAAVSGYAWTGGKVTRKPGESTEALLQRAELESMPMLEPWGGIVLSATMKGTI